MLSNNADEYGGQTIPEKVAEQLHGENTVIVKLTPTSVAPERPRLNIYTTEVGHRKFPPQSLPPSPPLRGLAGFEGGGGASWKVFFNAVTPPLPWGCEGKRR